MRLEDVLEALTEERVEQLLAAAGVDATGTRCPKCERLSTDAGKECPLDGARLLERASLLDDALRRAIEESAQIWLIEGSAEVPGGVAALTRF